MEILGKKKGCTKVDDPYFGKRKPPAILKRIQRKISLLESQKDHRQLNHGHPSASVTTTNLRINDRDNPSSDEMKKDAQLKSRSNENLTNAEKPQQHRASTAPGALPTSSISTDKWPTKDEFVSLLFRMIWHDQDYKSVDLVYSQLLKVSEWEHHKSLVQKSCSDENYQGNLRSSSKRYNLRRSYNDLFYFNRNIALPFSILPKKKHLTIFFFFQSNIGYIKLRRTVPRESTDQSIHFRLI